QHGHGAANARVAARDQGRHALELFAALVVGGLVAGGQFQIGFDAGLLQMLGGQIGGLWACAGLNGRLLLLALLLAFLLLLVLLGRLFLGVLGVLFLLDAALSFQS